MREVLAGIGAGEIRELKVFNKIDLMGAEEPGVERPRVVLGADGVPAQAWVSAASGAGLSELREAIAQAVRPNQVRHTLHLDMLGGGGALRSVSARGRARRAPVR